jgi:cell division protein FtsB
MHRFIRQYGRGLGWTAVVVLVVGYAVAQLTGSQGLTALLAKRRQIEQVEVENEQLKREIAERTQYLNDLKTNKDLQKRLVREKLLYVEDGMLDFKAPDSDKPAETTAPVH